MRMSVTDSTVFTAQAAPPVEYAELNITPVAASWVTPLASVHSGRSMMVSRGMETTLALLWPLYTCTIIAVSERALPSSAPPPSFLLLPERESEPRTRMFSEPLSTFVGRELPSAWSMSTLLMLPLSLKYTYPAPVPPTTTMPAAVQAVIEKTLAALAAGLAATALGAVACRCTGFSRYAGSGVLSADMCSSFSSGRLPPAFRVRPSVGTRRPVPHHRRSALVRRRNSRKGCTTQL